MFLLKVECPICEEEFEVEYDKDRDGYMIVECPNCSEQLVFAVVVRTKKVAYIDGDIQTVKAFLGEI